MKVVGACSVTTPATRSSLRRAPAHRTGPQAGPGAEPGAPSRAELGRAGYSCFCHPRPAGSSTVIRRQTSSPNFTISSVESVIIRSLLPAHNRNVFRGVFFPTRSRSVARIADRTTCQWNSRSSKVDDFYLSLTVSEIWPVFRWKAH